MFSINHSYLHVQDKNFLQDVVWLAKMIKLSSPSAAQGWRRLSSATSRITTDYSSKRRLSTDDGYIHKSLVPTQVIVAAS